MVNEYLPVLTVEMCQPYSLIHHISTQWCQQHFGWMQFHLCNGRIVDTSVKTFQKILLIVGSRYIFCKLPSANLIDSPRTCYTVLKYVYVAVLIQLLVDIVYHTSVFQDCGIPPALHIELCILYVQCCSFQSCRKKTKHFVNVFSPRQN